MAAQSQEYSIGSYCAMMTDMNRVVPYTRALEAVITPGSVVFDIGAATGLFSFIALEAGAARVYAIEPGPSLDLAREEAEIRGVADRIVFVQESSLTFDPPELADVITFDLRGVVPVFPGNIAATLDAAKRLLKPGGVMVPRSDTIMAALVEAPDAYRKRVDPWVDDDGAPWRGCVRANANQTHRVDLGDMGHALTEPTVWHTIHYGVTCETGARNTIRADVGRAGVAHGIALWFDADLADGIGFSTAPGSCGPIYGQLFLPFIRPVNVEAGDRIECRIHADAPGSEVFWSWRVTVVREGAVIEEMQHSAFNRDNIDAEALNRVINMNETVTASSRAALADRYEKSEQLLSCEVAGETVLLSLHDNEYFGLDAVGTHIWRKISPEVTVADLRAWVTGHFEVDDATCENDLLSLLGQLAERRLIDRVVVDA